MKLKSTSTYTWIKPNIGPRELYNAEQSRLIDQDCINHDKLAGFTLMERAGYAAYTCIRDCWPDLDKISIICGSGNNGGDGFIISHLLSKECTELSVIVIGHKENIQGDAKRAMQLAQASNVSIQFFPEINEHLTKRICTSNTELWVDAIMGTGLSRDLKPDYKELVQHINQHHAPTLSIDIPTGISADTGLILGAAIQATKTITFIALKKGLFRDAGKACTGHLAFADLGIPSRRAKKQKPHTIRLTTSYPKSLFPLKSTTNLLAADTHKGQQGTLLCIGGNYGMLGAILLSSSAALHTGIGKVLVATHKAHHPSIYTQNAELMPIDTDCNQAMKAAISQASAILIGPGLGQDSWAIALLQTALDSNKPTVIDADGLNLISKEAVSMPKEPGQQLVLTPHPGEAKRLMDEKTIRFDPFYCIEKLSAKYPGVMVLKGAGSLIKEHTKADIYLCDAGNPGLAKAGMGDTLAGTIAGLLGQKSYSPIEAAKLGTWLHATSADLLAKSTSTFNILPSSLPPVIGQLLATSVQGKSGRTEKLKQTNKIKALYNPCPSQ